jgi:hypothetical protein
VAAVHDQDRYVDGGHVESPGACAHVASPAFCRLRRVSHGPAMCTRRLHCPRSLPRSRMLAHGRR